MMTAHTRNSAVRGGELLALVQDAPRPSLEARGRMLFVRDVLELFPTKSRWWVNHRFLPSKKKKVGRDSFWYEADVVAAIDRNALTE